MSTFKEEFVNIDEHKRTLPITYHHLYRLSKKHIKKDQAYFGLRVNKLNTDSYFPYGHSKPISKIVDLTLFKKTDGER